MNIIIADLIESRLDSPEMARYSLHATLRFGEDLEQACVGTPLDGKGIRENLIPFRHGINSSHEYKLRRLAKFLRADSTFTLASMCLSNCDSSTICKASTIILGCVFSEELLEELIAEDLGL